MCVQRITYKSKKFSESILLPYSKSISNRVLVLNHILKLKNQTPINLTNISDADDTTLMLQVLGSNQNTVKLKNAGTCVRFLTALFAATPNISKTLFCDERMKLRPIKPLTDALIVLGADLQFLEKTNFLPLQITGKQLNGGEVTLNAAKSSQFASALMLISPLLAQPLKINLTGEIVSLNYLQLTANIINYFGGDVILKKNTITIANTLHPKTNFYTIEADWSSAVFWYQIVAFSKNRNVSLLGLNQNSWQGDSEVASFMKVFGVLTEYNQNGIYLRKSELLAYGEIIINLIHYPDLAPALICTAAALQLPIKFIGLQTLQYKESNRLDAIVKELGKLGYKFMVEDFTVKFAEKLTVESPQVLHTYNDHRLAMALAPLAIMHPEIVMDNIYVTEKSYPNYWEDLKLVGFEINEG